MAPKLVGAEKAERGKTPTDVWWHTIVSPTGKEKTGYATQKPVGMIERIVRVHSRAGERVLDFFAGSGTTGEAAARNGREFLLVDESEEAVRVMEKRLGMTAERKSMSGMTVQEQFGQIDIYVFDQILRGNLGGGMRVLDAGCGYGRNLVYLLREGAEVFAVDANAEGVEHVRQLAAMLAPGLPGENFVVSPIERMPFADGFADVVICNSVLHFAADELQFLAMVRELWRVLRVGGMLFCRLGSRIGMEFERGAGGRV